MARKKNNALEKDAPDSVIDAISKFLSSPPRGTPSEILEAFTAPGASDYLPPKLFLEAVEQAPVAISIADPNARILYVNRAFEDLSGYQRNEVIGKNESILSSKSTPKEVYRDLWETISSKMVWTGALVNHRKGRKEYVAELTIAPVFNHAGDVSYYLGMHRDITVMHKLERQLKFQKQLTEATLDAAPMVVAIIGSDGKVLLDNHAYKALLGDFRGVEPSELFLKAIEQQLDFKLSEVCSKGNGFNNVDVRLDPPGSTSPRWFSCSGVHMDELDAAAANFFSSQQQSRCCLLLLANEITSSRNQVLEARLNMIRANMVEQQMVQTMREAISASIFKLQGPLNIVRAALAIPDMGDVQMLRNALQEALVSGNEAMQELNDSLPTTKVEERVVVNINEILYEVIRLATDRLLGSGIVVDWQPEEVMPSINGRANQLRSLFKFLIDNAIDAINESTNDYREIRLKTLFDEHELIAEIIDNGPGISSSKRLKVFEPFYSGWQHSRGHSGMGLTMSQEIVMDHYGSIMVDEEHVGGCRIIVRLPVSHTGTE